MELPVKPRAQAWLFRLGALVLVPLLVLSGLEGLLRLAGYGYPTSFFLHRKIKGQDCLVENDRFGCRFFGPVMARAPRVMAVPASKPSETVRVFVLGESAAYGDPQPEFGLPRLLEVLLRDRYPGVHFEVINAAVTAINSHVILPIARCQLNGHARVRSMDEPLRNDEDGDEPLTLHDCLAADVDDPATTAGRNLDWETVLDSLDRTEKAILIAMAEGRELTLLVSRLKRSRTTLHYDKVKLGRLIQTCLGQDVLVEAQTRPGWTNTIDAIRERLTCRAERRAA